MNHVTRREGAAPAARIGHWELIAWAFWILIVVVALGRTTLYYRTSSARGSYPVFAGAGRHWLNGEDLYDHDDPNSLSVFRYSPLNAIGFAPLALVPDPVGSALLRAANLMAFAAGFWWWGRTVLPRTLSREGRAVAWLLCAGMGCVAMTDVQLNLATGGFILMAAAAASESRWNTAALAVSLACCLKAYPAALALVLAALYPRRFAPRWLAALALCLALPFLFRQPDYVWRQYGDWLRWGLNGRRPGDPTVAFQDVMLICDRWLTPISAKAYVLLEVAAGAAVAGFCLWRRLRGTPQREMVFGATALCCGWMMAFGPATEGKTYVQLAPVVAVATLYAWATSQGRWFRALVTTSCVLLTLSELELILPLHKPLELMAMQPIAALVFMLSAVGYVMGARARSAGRGRDEPGVPEAGPATALAA